MSYRRYNLSTVDEATPCYPGKRGRVALFDQLADALDYQLGRGIGFLDQRFELFTAFGFKRKFALLGFRDEFRVPSWSP